MRKLIAVVTAITVLLTAGAFADGLSALTDGELLALYQDVQEEMNRREIPDEPEIDREPAEIAKRVMSFFAAWNQNDPDEMLALCDAGWKATAKDPRTALLGILAGLTPLDVTVESVQEIAGNGPDGLVYDLVTVTAHLDRNNGQSPELDRIRLLVRKEEDGYWYINPTGLDTREAVEAEDPAGAEPGKNAGTAAADTVLYYQPAGGEYYHLDPNCKLVHPKYLPLQGSFLFSELNDEPYRHLKPCNICGAPLRPEEENSLSETGETGSLRFTAFKEAVASMEEGDAYTLSDEYAAALIRRNGRCFRVVAPLDEHAKELYAASFEDGNFNNDEYQALSEYAKTLPVQYTEELAVVPFTQEELDAMAGKTVGEVMSEPWELRMRNYPEDPEAGKDIVFPMVKGFCEYELAVNEPLEVYQERRARDRYDPVTAMSLENYLDLTVKSVKYTGISTLNALDLCYQADGTLQRDTEPFPEGYDYDLMIEIADYLAAAWEGTEPDRETKEALIAELTARYPQAEEMIRQIVESFH